MKYVFIKNNQNIFSITCLCHVLNFKSSSYYSWINRSVSNQQIHRNQCELLVRVAHDETKQRYGCERLHAHLAEQGHHISQYMVRRIKEEYGIKWRRHKLFKITTHSNHNKLIYPNLLDQKFDTNRPNKSWVSDINYIWTNEGWLYLAGVKDTYTKELLAIPLISA